MSDIPMRLGLFNVKYSPNLGDGLLSECLEAEIVRAVPGTVIRPLELAGRSTYGEGNGFRKFALALLDHSPTRLRHMIVEAMLGRALRTRMRPQWRRELRYVDATVLGGGNLFSDTDLNFPLKIDAAMAEVGGKGLPVAVYGVGVSDNWSSRGEELFCRAFSAVTPAYASVREPRSAAIWNRRLGSAGVPPAQVVHDPGVLVAHHVPKHRITASAPPLVGLGLTHPSALRYHADERSSSASVLTRWNLALVEACLAEGWRVAVFTNGSPEDDDYLRQMAPALSALDTAGRLTVVSRFSRPADLARFISGLDLLLAHRLHANIAAYSYAVPHIGLTWDSKLTSFLARVGRDDFAGTAGTDTPGATLALAKRALTEGIDPARHHTVLAEAREDIVRLSHMLQNLVAARRGAKSIYIHGAARL